MLFCCTRSGCQGLLFFCSVYLAVTATTCGQTTQNVSFRDRVVDLIILSNQTRLHGVSAPGRPATFLFRTEWLRAEAGEFFEKDVRPGITDALAEPASSEVTERLEQEILHLQQQPNQNLTRIGLLREFLQRQQQPPEFVPDLVLIEFAPSLIRRHQAQSPRNQHLGMLAMLNGIMTPERISRQQVAQRLNAIPDQRRIHSIPIGTVNTAEQQCQKLLAAVDCLSQHSIEFVSTGTRLIPRDAAAPATMLLPQMMEDSLKQQLQELLNAEAGPKPNSVLQNQNGEFGPSDLPETARVYAESRRVRTVAVTGFILRPEDRSAAVWRVMFYQVSAGRWLPVIRTSARAAGAEVPENLQAEVAADPQIRQITELVKLLNVESTMVAQALQMGATVKLASERHDAEFQNALSRILHDTNPDIRRRSIPLVRVETIESTAD